LISRGAAVTLLISPKEVDQGAVKSVKDMAIVTLPAVGLTEGKRLAFFLAALRSYRAAKRLFRETPVQAALAMGGFTSAPPILAARRLGARTFLHEANSIPGRANRLLAWVVDRAFVGFPGAAGRLRAKSVTVTGMPVRPQFNEQEQGAARAALGLNPTDPVILVTGGSQGATGINSVVERSLPLLAKEVPEWQWFHLTGPADAEKMKRAYAASNVRAVVCPFFDKMEQALGAATVAVSRAGASSLAEMAAMRLPAILVPYPAAVDNHQYHNALAFEESGAARLMEQGSATPEIFYKLLIELACDGSARAQIQNSLAKWHTPASAEEIAMVILRSVGVEADEQAGAGAQNQSGMTGSGTKPGTSLRRLPPELGRNPA
jgi:UDP-N-acetylglucosamine--N-acetylmuramyl-(pentapeptide) pyrophosphoryl-undecaprenol N-acetylglucosamine transferase